MTKKQQAVGKVVVYNAEAIISVNRELARSYQYVCVCVSLCVYVFMFVCVSLCVCVCVFMRMQLYCLRLVS